jgi:hypothetical protein
VGYKNLLEEEEEEEEEAIARAGLQSQRKKDCNLILGSQ